ncbi:class I SAM-dependent methyltransferase [Agromyces italicus]|uniref:class I SAM-dependent methyltransferase n=1 Tax=Agromyces italicus TaxID=279572 RepID=UPI001FE14B22|nr:class I SAM-dependent methyltransferase [Agromyces italicus]
MTLFRREARRTPLAADRRGIRVRFDSPAIGRVVDVEIDGRRMWSTRVPESGGRSVRVPWPPAVHDHLSGSGGIALRDKHSGVPLAEGRFALPIEPGGFGLAALAEAGQVIDKWGKLTDAPSEELHRRLIRSMQQVLADLAELGYTAAITGGTLLGAIREGAILAHDDDIDLLVYLGEAAPSDVSIASYSLERRIRERGHEVIRHSDAHLQLIFVGSERLGPSRSEVHVDLFLGFHDRGVYNQPIAVRGEFASGSLLPLRQVELNGESVPSVGDADAWLALCYGAEWRTPDPSFRFETPMSTRRRFEHWFGVYDFNRDFWERRVRFGRPVHWSSDADRLLSKTRRGDRVLDLGCGDGELAASLAAAGRRVVGVDYARTAVEATAEHKGVVARWLNLADRRAVLGLIADESAVGGTRHFLLSNVLHTLTREARANTFLLLRALLDPDSVALASFAVNASFVFDHQRPDTWHLPLDWLRDEASGYGIGFTVVGRRVRKTTAGRRTVVTVRFHKTSGVASAAQEEAP